MTFQPILVMESQLWKPNGDLDEFDGTESWLDMQGQKTYKVPKDKLITILKENRSKHVELHKAAHTKWKAAVVAALQSALALAEDGTEFKTTFNLPEPTLHVREYDHVIGLLELTSEDIIEITNADYRTYCQDEWGWKQAFLGVTSSYIGEGAA